MRFIRLTVRIALFFAILMSILLILTLHLFGRIMSDEYIRELGSIRAQDGVRITEQLEEVLEENDIDAEPIAVLLDLAAEERDVRITLMDKENRPIIQTPGAAPRAPHRRWHELEVRGRPCEVAGPPGFR